MRLSDSNLSRDRQPATTPTLSLLKRYRSQVLHVSFAHLVVRGHNDGDGVERLRPLAQHLPDGIVVRAEAHDLDLRPADRMSAEP